MSRRGAFPPTPVTCCASRFHGWHLLHWSGFDHPAAGDGGNIWTGADTPERPRQIEVPVPVRSGDSIASYTLWVISADGRVVGQLEISFAVTIG